MGCFSSNSIGLILCNYERDNNLQKDYGLKVKTNLRNDKRIKIDIKFLEGDNFFIKFQFNGKVYNIQNSFDDSLSSTNAAIGKIDRLILENYNK